MRSIDIPIFTRIQSGAINFIPKVLKENNLTFQRVLVLSDPITYKVAGLTVQQQLQKTSTVESFMVNDNQMSTVNLVSNQIKEMNFDGVVAVGGGRVIDVAKLAAAKSSISLITVPTSPSHDGIASSMAIIMQDSNSQSLVAKIPLGIIVDLDIIRKSPIKNIRAGICDLLSNLTAVRDWRLAYEEGKDTFDQFSASIALASADFLLSLEKIDILSDEFLERLLDGLILSGTAMTAAGSSKPCSGAEHKISHALDALYPGRAMHGEQVGIGMFVSYFLHKLDLASLTKFMKAIGAPTHYKELGFTRDEMINALVYAPMTRPGRYTILEHSGIDKKKSEEIIDQVFQKPL